MDLSGLDATPEEISGLFDALAEYDEEPAPYGDDARAADWAASLSDEQFADLLGEYEADQALATLDGPELAGADTAGTVDLAGDVQQIDRMLATMTDREHARQAADADLRSRREGPRHRRPTDEIILSNGLARIGAGTYTYGGLPAADLANTPWQGGTADDLFSTGPRLNALEIQDQMRYQLLGGARPQGRGQFRPPVKDLAARIGLR